jgi:hypothetical protein
VSYDADNRDAGEWLTWRDLRASLLPECHINAAAGDGGGAAS